MLQILNGFINKMKNIYHSFKIMKTDGGDGERWHMVAMCGGCRAEAEDDDEVLGSSGLEEIVAITTRHHRFG